MVTKLHTFVRHLILSVLDWLHRSFFRFIPLQKFRYLACGGGSTCYNISIYAISYNFILQKRVLDLSIIVISPHIAAFLIAFCLTFPVGFYLNLFVVWEGSYLNRKTQLFRYFLVSLMCILLNYVFIKLFVEQFGWYPTPSAIATTAIVTVFSYSLQQHFSFKKKRE